MIFSSDNHPYGTIRCRAVLLIAIQVIAIATADIVCDGGIPFDDDVDACLGDQIDNIFGRYDFGKCRNAEPGKVRRSE